MYLNNLFIDYREVNFFECKTFKQREDKITNIQVYLINQHIDKILLTETNPEFYIMADSKANIIIQYDLQDNLVNELNDEWATAKAIKKLKNKKRPCK